MSEQLLFTDPHPSVYFEVVTGTHSAGKSTLLENLANEDMTAALTDIYDGETAVPFTAGTVPITLEGSTYNVPLVLCPEAATAYVKRNGRPELLTTGYEFRHQIGMELLAYEAAQEAEVLASELALQYPPLPQLGQCAIVLSDRCTVDGRAYSQLRTPEEDQDAPQYISFKMTGHGSSRPATLETVPVRSLFDSFVAERCSYVFTADHADIPLEDNGYRLPDMTFRDTVGALIEFRYDYVAANALRSSLVGDKASRVEQFYAGNQYLFQRMYEAVR